VPIRGSQVRSTKYGYASCIPTFFAFVLFTVGIIFPLGYFSMRSGLRYSAGALLPGTNIRPAGSYDALRVCYGIAEADEDVIGFMWSTDNANPQPGRVVCEFKQEGTTWVEAQTGQTAVVKMKNSWGCGLLTCTGIRESTMVDLYDCNVLGSILAAAQGLAFVAMASSGLTLFLQSVFLWDCFVKRLVFLAQYLRLFHIITAVSGGVSSLLLFVGFVAEFCGRTLSRDAQVGPSVGLMAAGALCMLPPILLVKKGLGPLKKEDPREKADDKTRRGDEGIELLPPPPKKEDGVSPFGGGEKNWDEDDDAAPPGAGLLANMPLTPTPEAARPLS